MSEMSDKDMTPPGQLLEAMVMYDTSAVSLYHITQINTLEKKIPRLMASNSTVSLVNVFFYAGTRISLRNVVTLFDRS